MATVCLVLRVFFSSCAVTGDASETANKVATPAVNHRLRISMILFGRFLFSNFIGELVLYARNFYGFAINNPGLVFEFQRRIERCPVEQA